MKTDEYIKEINKAGFGQYRIDLNKISFLDYSHTFMMVDSIVPDDFKKYVEVENSGIIENLSFRIPEIEDKKVTSIIQWNQTDINFFSVKKTSDSFVLRSRKGTATLGYYLHDDLDPEFLFYPDSNDNLTNLDSDIFWRMVRFMKNMQQNKITVRFGTDYPVKMQSSRFTILIAPRMLDTPDERKINNLLDSLVPEQDASFYETEE